MSYTSILVLSQLELGPFIPVPHRVPGDRPVCSPDIHYCKTKAGICEGLRVTVSSSFLEKSRISKLLRQQKNIPALIQALRYEDFEVQTSAAEALGTLGAEGIDELILALKTKDKDVRLGIIEALTGDTGSPVCTVTRTPAH